MGKADKEHPLAIVGAAVSLSLKLFQGSAPGGPASAIIASHNALE